MKTNAIVRPVFAMLALVLLEPTVLGQQVDLNGTALKIETVDAFLARITKLTAGDDFATATKELEKADVKRLAQLQMQENNPRYIGESNFDLEFPGVPEEQWPRIIETKSFVLLKLGGRESKIPPAPRAETEVAVRHFIHRYNLLMFHFDNIKNWRYQFRTTFEDAMRRVHFSKEQWNGLTLEQKLAIRDFIERSTY